MIDQAFKNLQTYTWGDDRKTLDPIDAAIVASQGDVAARKQLEDRMIAVLKSDATRNGKDFVCRKLKIVGTKSSVPTLAAMLGDADHSHMARYALESMPNEAAGDALRQAASELSGKLKAGVISSLGVRKDDACVPMLAALLSDSDGTVAKAAASALSAIRTSAAAKALSGAKPNAAAAASVVDASLSCAEGLLAAGDKLGALKIYKTLAKSQTAKHVKLAATRGMLACAGKS